MSHSPTDWHFHFDFSEILPKFFSSKRNVRSTEDLYNFRLGDVRHVPGFERVAKNAVHRLLPDVVELVDSLPGMQGHSELVKQLADLVTEETGIASSFEHIQLTDGGCDGIALASLATCAPGQGIAYAVPAFPYWAVLGPLPFSQHPVLFESPDEYRDQFAEKMICLLRENKHIKAVILNEPQNPMGIRLGEEQLRRFADYVSRNEVTVIVDDVGRGLVKPNFNWWGRMLPESSTIVVDSFTKRFACPGLRLGWVRAHPSIIAGIRRIIANMRAGVGNFAAHFGHCLIAELKSMDSQSAVRDEIVSRQAELRAAMTLLPADLIDAFIPDWGLYGLLNTEKLFQKTGISGRGLVGAAAAESVLIMSDAFIFPQSSESDRFKNLVRISIGGETRIDEGLSRLSDVIRKIGNG